MFYLAGYSPNSSHLFLGFILFYLILFYYILFILLFNIFIYSWAVYFHTKILWALEFSCVF